MEIVITLLEVLVIGVLGLFLMTLRRSRTLLTPWEAFIVALSFLAEIIFAPDGPPRERTGRARAWFILLLLGEWIGWTSFAALTYAGFFHPALFLLDAGDVLFAIGLALIALKQTRDNVGKEVAGLGLILVAAVLWWIFWDTAPGWRLGYSIVGMAGISFSIMGALQWLVGPLANIEPDLES